MANFSIGQKAERVLNLLLGLRDPRVAEALAAHGFGTADVAEGWSLLQKVTRTRLDDIPLAQGADPNALTQLDAWENRWFPIASATLNRHAGKAHAWLFHNLAQTEGQAVVISVGTFVERVELLSKKQSEGGFGTGGKEARKLLEQRGISPEVIAEAKALLQKLGVVSPGAADLKKSKAQKAEFDVAEQALWAWYLEWSVIARSAISERVLLRSLGFLKRRAGSGAEAEAEGAEDEQDAGEAEAGDEDGSPEAEGEDSQSPSKPA